MWHLEDTALLWTLTLRIHPHYLTPVIAVEMNSGDDKIGDKEAEEEDWNDNTTPPFYPQYPYMPPFTPPLNQWGPYHGPMMYPQGPRPFLGYGQNRPRGRWKHNQQPQVQWAEEPEEGKQQGQKMDMRSKTAKTMEPRAGTSKSEA